MTGYLIAAGVFLIVLLAMQRAAQQSASVKRCVGCGGDLIRDAERYRYTIHYECETCGATYETPR